MSTFQFGIPLTGIGEVDDSPEVWQELAVPGWEEALVTGRTELRFRGRSVGTLLYAMLPGRASGWSSGPSEQLTATLVRGTLATQMPIQAFADPGTFAVYVDRPRPSIGPRDSPALTAALLAQPEFSTIVDGSRLRGWTHRSSVATEVILLRASRPLESLERVGIQALGTLLCLVGPAGAHLPRRGTATRNRAADLGSSLQVLLQEAAAGVRHHAAGAAIGRDARPAGRSRRPLGAHQGDRRTGGHGCRAARSR